VALVEEQEVVAVAVAVDYFVAEEEVEVAVGWAATAVQWVEVEAADVAVVVVEVGGHYWQQQHYEELLSLHELEEEPRHLGELAQLLQPP